HSLSLVPLSLFLLFSVYGHRRHRPSFPTRRSSDLMALMLRLGGMRGGWGRGLLAAAATLAVAALVQWAVASGHIGAQMGLSAWQDRKSTRLNSSHVKISYAVFCLKKKKKMRITLTF